MTTEEIRKEIEEEGSIRRTCPHCHTRIRVKPSRVTCPSCGKSFFKKPEEEKKKEEKVVRVSKPKVLKAPPAITEKQKKEVKNIPAPSSAGENLFFIKSKRGAEAMAKADNDGITVLKGSRTAPDWVTSTPEAVREKGKSLRSEGVIVDDKFIQDYLFKSSSMAAAIVMGRSANGLREWRSKDGQTLKELR